MMPSILLPASAQANRVVPLITYFVIAASIVLVFVIQWLTYYHPNKVYGQTGNH